MNDLVVPKQLYDKSKIYKKNGLFLRNSVDDISNVEHLASSFVVIPLKSVVKKVGVMKRTSAMVTSSLDRMNKMNDNSSATRNEYDSSKMLDELI